MQPRQESHPATRSAVTAWLITGFAVASLAAAATEFVLLKDAARDSAQKTMELESERSLRRSVEQKLGSAQAERSSAESDRQAMQSRFETLKAEHKQLQNSQEALAKDLTSAKSQIEELNKERAAWDGQLKVRPAMKEGTARLAEKLPSSGNLKVLDPVSHGMRVPLTVNVTGDCPIDSGEVTKILKAAFVGIPRVQLVESSYDYVLGAKIAIEKPPMGLIDNKSTDLRVVHINVYFARRVSCIRQISEGKYEEDLAFEMVTPWVSKSILARDCECVPGLIREQVQEMATELTR